MCGIAPLLPTIYTFMAWSAKTIPFITFHKLLNSIYLYRSFHASAFRVKYAVKTGITFLHDNARPNNARLIPEGGGQFRNTACGEFSPILPALQTLSPQTTMCSEDEGPALRE